MKLITAIVNRTIPEVIMQENDKTRVSLISLLLTVSFLSGCTASPTQIEREKKIAASPHYKDGKFVNSIPTPIMAEGTTWEYLKESFFGDRVDPQPKGAIPMMKIQSTDWENTDSNRLWFAWLGHSSILISMEGLTILVDPVLDERASPFSFLGPKRFHPTPVSTEELPPIDVILITHDHYDHLEKDTMRALANKADHFLVPLGIGELLEDWGISPSKIVDMDWWDSLEIGTLSFNATPALHYARRWILDGDKRLWCSWSIKGKTNNVFISGDSGYYDIFTEIGQKIGPFDIAFLKIGSYEDRFWTQIHMNPEQAVQQFKDVRGKLLVPLHWATFDLGLHSWYEPIERMVAAADKNNIAYITPMIGQLVEIGNLPKTST
jgi:L-ascorbate metabolism protein UlaG (beta-lactamase superfamily)